LQSIKKRHLRAACLRGANGKASGQRFGKSFFDINAAIERTWIISTENFFLHRLYSIFHSLAMEMQAESISDEMAEVRLAVFWGEWVARVEEQPGADSQRAKASGDRRPGG